MPTDRKHIAVYLTAANEERLDAYRQEYELSFSAAVNQILEAYFAESNTLENDVDALKNAVEEIRGRVERLESQTTKRSSVKRN